MRLEMLSAEDFKKLTSEQEGPLVSLYLPITAEGQANENRKRLTVTLSDAETKLGEFGLSPKGCAQFLAPARAYAEQEWQTPRGGRSMALFLSPSSFYAYTLPSDVPECMQIGAHFCVAPLLPLLRKNAECYLLAVSKKHARLLHVDSERVNEVEVDGLPKNFDEAFDNRLEFQDKEVHTHGGGPGASAAQFHGQGGAKDLSKEELEEYLHKIAKATDHVLKDQKAPLFFAGIEEEFGMFRKYASYPHLQERRIDGNPDTLQTEELYERVVELMSPVWAKEREVALEVYGPLAGTGRTSTDVQAILDLSYHGKVEGLLVAEGAMQWGKMHPDSGVAEFHDRREPGDNELLGLAAIHTMQHKGWVRALPAEKMPEKADIAAVLRY